MPRPVLARSSTRWCVGHGEASPRPSSPEPKLEAGQSRSARSNPYRALFSSVNLPIVVEMDVVDQATISIDRNSLVIKEPRAALHAFRTACDDALEEFAKYQASSPYLDATIALLV